MARISDPTRTQAPSQSPDTSSPRAPGRFRRFPWWVFLPVGLCLCGSVAAYIWLSADIQQQQQAAAAARATANAVPTQFDHPPGFGIITNTPEPPYSPAATPTRWPTDTPYVDYFIPAIETANAAWMLASYATETAMLLLQPSLTQITPRPHRSALKNPRLQEGASR